MATKWSALMRLPCRLMAPRSAWCTDQRCRRNGPYLVLGSGDADIARASQLQHAVEDMHRHVDFSRSPFISMGAQPVADHLFPSPDRGLGLRAPVVTRDCLPGYAARLGDTPEVAVTLRRRDVSRWAWHRRGLRRHNHRRLRVTVGNRGINTVLIVDPITHERGQWIDDLLEQRADLRAVVHIF